MGKPAPGMKKEKRAGVGVKRHVGHQRERKARPEKRKKKDAFPDFKKKPGRKIGKKKLKPAKATNPVVRSKGIVIRSARDPGADDGQPRTARGQALSEVLPKLHHYSGNVRRDAFTALAGLAAARDPTTGAPVVTAALAGSLLLRCLPAVLEEDPGVRAALLGTLRALFTHALPRDRVQPFIKVLLRYANVALTHVLADIQKVGVDLLSHFMQAYRSELRSADLCSAEGAQVLCSLARFSRAEFTLAGRRTASSLQVLDLLVAMLQIRTGDGGGDGGGPLPSSSPAVSYDDFWGKVPLHDPLLAGQSGDRLDSLKLSKKARRRARHQSAPREQPVAAAPPLEAAPDGSSTPAYFHLRTPADRLLFFDDLTAVLRSRWAEINPSSRKAMEEEGAAAALREAGYVVLVVNAVVTLVAPPPAAPRDVLPGPRRGLLLRTFVHLLPLPPPMDAAQRLLRRHATLQLALLGAAFLPPYRVRSAREVEPWALAIFRELKHMLAHDDDEALEAPCTPCASAPLSDTPCIAHVMTVAGKLMRHLPAALGRELSSALLRRFTGSPPTSATTREGVRFLRCCVDAPTPPGQWVGAWAAALPRLLWETRDAPAAAAAAGLLADVLHVLRAVLCLLSRTPADPATSPGLRDRRGRAERRALQRSVVKAVWAARCQRPSGPPLTVRGCLPRLPATLQAPAAALLFHFHWAAPEAPQYLESMAAALAHGPLPPAVLLTVVEALHAHRRTIAPALHARFLCGLPGAADGAADGAVPRAVAAALRSIVLAAPAPEDRDALRKVTAELRDGGGGPPEAVRWLAAVLESTAPAPA